MNIITLAAGDHEFFLPDGRKLHLYIHTCSDCTSLDVWTTRGNDHEEISRCTGDTTRAPMGLMPWLNGLRPKLDAQPCAGSFGWPAVSTATLVWDGGTSATADDETPMTAVSTRAPRIWVRCEDGEVRHDEPFATMADASYWAEWGHACSNRHDYEEVAS